ncbi:MAG: hypothetical protein FWD02_00315 [Bacteroidales bacterium]|nr:hypothetical protein [Bacteroidales bacterium]
MPCLVFGEDTVAGVQNDYQDSIQNDTLALLPNDTVNLEENRPSIPRSQSAIESRIDYQAQDSIFFDLRTNTVHLFERAQVNYQDIELTAARINVHFDRDELSAFPRVDSLGQEIDRPFFRDSRQTFEARELTYNLATRKARIRYIITQEDEMFIHGERVKKFPDNTAFVQRARFTTCPLEDPHWYIVARRARIIPNDKVVTGGAMMFLNNVPTPLAVPFGLFPNTSRYASGILVPTYGETHGQNASFFLRGGGFYWAINDFVHWRIEGDIYSRGDWALRNTWQYALRYRFSGNFNISLGMVPSGERGVMEGPHAFGQTRSFRLGWTHSQAPEANQNSSFSASVNFFNTASQRYSLNIADHFNNQSTSNIAYQLRFGRFNLAATASLDYNITTGNINATLPSVNLSMRPIFPFQRRVQVGARRWYESFRIGYSMNAVNRVSGNDSAFWIPEIFQDMVNGMRHNIPMDLNIRILNGHVNWSHSIQLTEHWNFRKNHRGLDTIGFRYENIFDENDELIRIDTIPNVQRNAIIHTEHGFFASRSYSYTTSLSTTLFGISRFNRGPIRAFRHVATPSIGFSISPDFVEGRAGYRSGFRYFQDLDGTYTRYNLFDGSPAGFPTGGLSGSINFSLGNNFEMKVRDRSDTVRGERRVRLIDRLQISTSYNLAADSLNWAPINVSGSTRLFGNLSINFNARFDMYARAIDTLPGGALRITRINTFMWQQPSEGRRRFLLRESEGMSTGFSWSRSSRDRAERAEQGAGSDDIFMQRATFAPQWSLNVSYNINYRGNFRPGYQRTDIWGRPLVGESVVWRDYDRTIMQTLSFSGHVNLTDKWHISFTSGYDFTNRQLAHTMFNVTRDLCCWTMTFTWAPFGQFREWSFGIRLNSNMLGDVMKYDRRRTHREQYNF